MNATIGYSPDLLAAFTACYNYAGFFVSYLHSSYRASYIEFLRPFAMKREVWKHGNNMLDLMTHPGRELPIADIGEYPQKGLIGISSKLRQKVSSHKSLIKIIFYHGSCSTFCQGWIVSSWQSNC